jgi:hypothetical protein
MEPSMELGQALFAGALATAEALADHSVDIIPTDPIGVIYTLWLACARFLVEQGGWEVPELGETLTDIGRHWATPEIAVAAVEAKAATQQ